MAADPKVWFITGTSKGFGRIWAEAALARGDRVAATARDVKTLSPLVERYGDRVAAIALDVTDKSAVDAAIKQTVADMGSLARLPLILSDGHLRELALTGHDISAARAEKIGLVNDVYEDADQTLAAAHATAAEIAANPPLAVYGVKDVLDQQRASAVSENLRYVAAWNAAFLPSKDLTEGISATFAKRPPQFTGE